MEVQARLLDHQKELCSGLVNNNSPVEEQSLNSMKVIKSLVSHQNVDENTARAIVDGVKGYKALFRQDGLSQESSAISCMLACGPDPSLSIEQDFTTNGTQGSLHCPFSKPPSPRPGSEARYGNGDGPKIQVDTCGHGDLDPIKAEQEERRSSTVQSAQASSSASRCHVSRCPIRFLDKHSPEEIAEYVERHKHEIPRSHAICVKRYQRDPQNMRQLDAKYGGLINMISGLSAKHQAFLPDRQPNGGDEGHVSHSASSERVEKWAENVDPVTPGPVDEGEDEDRKGHFDRPLREVRVGESPSRPWGIPVPLTQQPTPSAPFSGSVSASISARAQPADASLKTPADTPAKPTGRCPFGHDAPQPDPEPAKPKSPRASWTKEDKLQSPRDWMKDVKDDKDQGDTEAGARKTEDTTMKTDTSAVPSHVTFNGPVFFGYSAEQTASLMQQLGQLGRP